MPEATTTKSTEPLDTSNSIFQKAVSFVRDTEANLFLTGRAGTGGASSLKNRETTNFLHALRPCKQTSVDFNRSRALNSRASMNKPGSARKRFQ